MLADARSATTAVLKSIAVKYCIGAKCLVDVVLLCSSSFLALSGTLMTDCKIGCGLVNIPGSYHTHGTVPNVCELPGFGNANCLMLLPTVAGKCPM